MHLEKIVLSLTVSTREIQYSKQLKQNTRLLLFIEISRDRWPRAGIAASWAQGAMVSFCLVAFLYRFNPKITSWSNMAAPVPAIIFFSTRREKKGRRKAHPFPIRPCL